MVLYVLYIEEIKTQRSLNNLKPQNGVEFESRNFTPTSVVFPHHCHNRIILGGGVVGEQIVLSLSEHSQHLASSEFPSLMHMQHTLHYLCPWVIPSMKLDVFERQGQGFGCFPIFDLSTILPCA